MRWKVRFTSSSFTPFLPDECQVNPGVYGAELAFWLAKMLHQQSVTTSYPDYEDYCWMLSYADEQYGEHRLCCHNIEGADDHWLCWIESSGRWFGWRTDVEVGATPLYQGLRLVLDEEPTITDIEWLEKP